MIFNLTRLLDKMQLNWLIIEGTIFIFRLLDLLLFQLIDSIKVLKARKRCTRILNVCKLKTPNSLNDYADDVGVDDGDEIVAMFIEYLETFTWIFKCVCRMSQNSFTNYILWILKHKSATKKILISLSIMSWNFPQTFHSYGHNLQKWFHRTAILCNFRHYVLIFCV